MLPLKMTVIDFFLSPLHLFVPCAFSHKIDTNMYEEPQADGQIKLFPVLFFKLPASIIFLILVTSDHIPAFA